MSLFILEGGKLLLKYMILTLDTALSLISLFHEFLNVSIWTVIMWTWCWHFPKKCPIPTIAQECRFWQGWIRQFAHLEKQLEFSSEALKPREPSRLDLSEPNYNLFSILIPKGLNIFIGCYFLCIFQLICL